MLRSLLRWWHARAAVACASGPGIDPAARKQRVLVLGVYLADRRNTVAHLVDVFSRSARFEVTQRWVAIGGEPPDAAVAAVTVEQLRVVTPKFAILNRMLAQSDWQKYDYLLFCDDDIVVSKGFLDAFLSYQIACDFALAQPARTRMSYADRKFARVVRGIRARRTRFVEIGPLVSVRCDFAPRILPFDESSPMGWGYDFVWPVLAEAAGLRLGIVDATPVDHSLRGQASAYSSIEASRAMIAYLEKTPHLKKQDAFTVLETY
jgi:hypothetical protein